MSTGRPIVLLINLFDFARISPDSHVGFDKWRICCDVLMDEFKKAKPILLKVYGLSVEWRCSDEIISAEEFQLDSNGEQFMKCLKECIANLPDDPHPSNPFGGENVTEENKKILLLYSLKLTPAQLSGIVDIQAKYPLIDGVVTLKFKNPNGTIAEASHEEPNENEIPLYQKSLVDFILLKIREVGDLWLDITTNEVEIDDFGLLLSAIDESRRAFNEFSEVYNTAEAAVAGGKPTKTQSDAIAAAQQAMTLGEDKLKACKVELSEKFGNCVPEIAKLLQSLLLSKNEFHSWGGEAFSVVPNCPEVAERSFIGVCEASRNDYSGIWKSNKLYAKYTQEANYLSNSLVSPGAVLYCMLRAVAANIAGDVVNSNWSTSPLSHALVKEGHCKVILGSKDSGKLNTLSSFYKNALQAVELPADVISFEDGDTFMLRASRAFRFYQKKYPTKCVSNNISKDSGTNEVLAEAKPVFLDDMMHPTASALGIFLKQARFRGLIDQVLGSGRLPRFASLSSVERSVRETELLTFSTLSATDLNRYYQLLEFHKLLTKNSGLSIEDFTGSLRKSMGFDEELPIHRKFYRHMTPLTLQQILADQLLKDPEIYRTYYPLTDDLLMMLHWPSPTRRMGRKSWCASEVLATRQSYKFFINTKKNLKVSEMMPPAVPILGTSSEEMKIFRRDTVLLTPAGKAMVFLNKTATSGDCWASIFLDDAIFGLRRYYDPCNEAMKGFVAPEEVSEAGEEREPVRISPVVQVAQALLKKDKRATCRSGCFFAQIHDTRFSITSASVDDISYRKPDGKGIVCLSASFPSGLTVSVTSDNTVKMSKMPYPVSMERIGDETSRMVTRGGLIVRYFTNSPYSSEMYHRDGTRTLMRNQSSSTVKLTGFHAKLLSEAPANWTFVRLYVSGAIYFYTSKLGDRDSFPSAPPTFRQKSKNFKSVVDVETKAKVRKYIDGRVIVEHVDGLVEIFFLDGTTLRVYADENFIFITKPEYPSIEVDVNNDKCCFGHAHGEKVPLSKGGDKIRSLIACPDGTSIFVKYDITITATVNGSIKAVFRDRTVIRAFDGGDVQFVPNTSWNDKAELEFSKDCEDMSRKFINDMNNNNESIAQSHAKRSVNSVSFADDGSVMTKKSHKMKEASVASQKPGRPMKSPRSASPEARTSPSTANIVAKLKAQKETKYFFNIDQLSCHIEDYECNHFYININDTVDVVEREETPEGVTEYLNTVPNDPLQPTLDLSGELEGMIVTAVTDAPIDPRLFIIHRDGRATEIVSSKIVESKRNLSQVHIDSYTQSGETVTPPCDLGGGSFHSIFTRERLCDGGDSLKFNEVFQIPGRINDFEREWHHRPHASAVAFALADLRAQFDKPLLEIPDASVDSDPNVLYKRKGSAEIITDLDISVRNPRIFSTYTVQEIHPLSSSGYEELSHAITSWQNFRKARVENLNRFVNVDPRSQEEIELDEKLKTRIKMAYRNAKPNKEKKKDRSTSVKPSAQTTKAVQEAQKSARANRSTIANASASPRNNLDVAFDNTKHRVSGTSLTLNLSATNLQGIAEGDSDDEYQPTEEEEEDEIQKEIDDAFAHFAVFDDDMVARIEIRSVRPALVQIFNCKVPGSLVSDAFAQEEIEQGQETLSLEQFSKIYYRCEAIKEGRALEIDVDGIAASDSLSSLDSNSLVSLNSFTNAQGGRSSPTFGLQAGRAGSPGSIGARSGSPALGSLGGRSGSGQGARASSPGLGAAPNGRNSPPVGIDTEEQELRAYGLKPGEKDYPVGTGMRVVRNRVDSFEVANMQNN